jgi:hypothetical protein
MELTDLELNKKIAEIDGYKGDDFYLFENKYPMVKTNKKGHLYWTAIEFNPITDKALCFDLMVKHEISHYATLGNAFKQHRAFYEYITEDDGIERFTVMHKDLQRAILLAIVAKFEAVK